MNQLRKLFLPLDLTDCQIMCLLEELPALHYLSFDKDEHSNDDIDQLRIKMETLPPSAWINEKHINIKESSGIYTLIKFLGENNNSDLIESLSFKNITTPDLNLIDFSKLHKVKHYTFGGNEIEDSDLSHLSKLTQLEKLTLMDCHNITSDSLINIKNLSSLKEIECINTNLSEESFSHIANLRALQPSIIIKQTPIPTPISSEGLFAASTSPPQNMPRP